MNYLDKIKVNVAVLILSILVPFSGMYLTRLMPLSPIYFSFILALLLFIGYALTNFNRIRILGFSFYPALIWFGYLVITQAFLNPDGHTLINVLMSAFYYILMLALVTSTPNSALIKIVDYMIWLMLPVLIIECGYRLTHPVFITANNAGFQVDVDEGAIYPFKYNSIMYQDSNFVGIYLVSLFFLIYYLYNYVTNRKIYVYMMLVLFILTALTLARGANSSLIIFFLFFFVSKKIGFTKSFLLFLVIAILFKLFFLKDVEQDSSLQSRFLIVDRAIDFLEGATLLQVLFGVGLGNSIYYLDIGSHNFFVTYIVETGFVGLLIMLLFWLSIAYVSKWNVLFVMLPFVIAGMSLAGHAIPYLYVIFAIIIKLSDKNHNYDKIQQTSYSGN